MKYRLIPKSPNTQPKVGVYSDWKIQIADECFKQCVYCGINESCWGGIDHYHIDHFRPKSKYADLENDICNLFYACPVCNRFKSDDWPNEPDINLPSYPDPSLVDYSSIFAYNSNTFLLKGLNVSANYLVNRLFLNRAQLIYERRENFLKEKELNLFNWINENLSQIKDPELLQAINAQLYNIRQHLAKRDSIRPYKLTEIKKQSA